MGNSIDRHWMASFHNNDILFASNLDDSYVGARSIVDGMGLSWGTQYLKIKKEFSGFLIKTVGRDARPRDILAMHKNFIESFLGTIDISRVSLNNKEIVNIYKNKFVDFVNHQTCKVEEPRTVDFYINSADGIKCLVMDSFKLQNQGVIKRFTELFKYIQANPKSIGEHYILPDTMLDIAEILAVNQHKL